MIIGALANALIVKILSIFKKGQEQINQISEFAKALMWYVQKPSFTALWQILDLLISENLVSKQFNFGNLPKRLPNQQCVV